jgi:hypothetical protein
MPRFQQRSLADLMEDYMTSFRRAISVLMVTVLAGFMFARCGGGGIEGVYTDPQGSMMLELKSGGKASITFMTETKACTYNVADKKIPVTCAGDVIEFTMHDDGSLTGPPGSIFPILKKSEKK